MSHTSRIPLRLLVVTDGATLPNWLVKCLADLERSGAGTVVVALRAARPDTRKPRRWAFSLYRMIDRHFARRAPDALAAFDPHSAFPGCRVVDLRHDTSLARVLAAEHIDVVLDPFSLLPDAGAADLATYGVWSLSCGDTPVFWDVIEGKPTETRLTIQLKRSETKRVLYSSIACTDPHSLSRAQNHVYWKISAALVRNIQRLWDDPDGFLERSRAGAPVAEATSRPGAPGNLAMLRAGTRLARRCASDRWARAVYRDQWALAYQRSGNGPTVTGAFHTLL